MSLRSLKRSLLEIVNLDSFLDEVKKEFECKVSIRTQPYPPHLPDEDRQLHIESYRGCPHETANPLVVA
jgi:hypothetical protein